MFWLRNKKIIFWVHILNKSPEVLLLNFEAKQRHSLPFNLHSLVFSTLAMLSELKCSIGSVLQLTKLKKAIDSQARIVEVILTCTHNRDANSICPSSRIRNSIQVSWDTFWNVTIGVDKQNFSA